jgi:hypothetical protein
VYGRFQQNAGILRSAQNDRDYFYYGHGLNTPDGLNQDALKITRKEWHHEQTAGPSTALRMTIFVEQISDPPC